MTQNRRTQHLVVSDGTTQHRIVHEHQMGVLHDREQHVVLAAQRELAPVEAGGWRWWWRWRWWWWWRWRWRRLVASRFRACPRTSARPATARTALLIAVVASRSRVVVIVVFGKVLVARRAVARLLSGMR